MNKRRTSRSRMHEARQIFADARFWAFLSLSILLIQNMYIGFRWDGLIHHHLYGYWPGELMEYELTLDFNREFDFARCESSSKIYVYDQTWQSVQSCPEEMVTPNLDARINPTNTDYGRRVCFDYASILRGVEETGLITNKSEDACLFIPPFDTLCLLNKCYMHETLVYKDLAALKHWNGGQNHIVFELADNNDEKYFTGRAIKVRSAFDRRFYRKGYDVQVPLFNKWEINPGYRHKNVTEREYLATFKGSTSHIKRFRTEFLKNHNGVDFLVYLNCERKDPEDTYYCNNFEAMNLDANYDEKEYNDLLVNSKFALVPRGFGLHSYRLLEGLSAGSIPVIIADGYVLPFEEIINWESFSIILPEKYSEKVDPILRSITEERLIELQQNAIYAFEEFFSSPEKVTQLALKQVLERATRYSPNYLRGDFPSNVERGFPPIIK